MAVFQASVWTRSVWHAFTVIALLLIALIDCNVAYHGDDDVTNVRLMDGRTVHDGRVEVLHSGVWGTVCDDRFDHRSCSVICRQLGYRNGTCLNEDGSLGCRPSYYGESTLTHIWLDELSCFGFENSIDQCQHNGWGKTNCQHKEDAGCICQPLSAQSSHLPGVCNVRRHRIRPFDVAVPGRGRVEVQTIDGTWGLVCDDVWNDLSAQVFCSCLGYRQREYFRAVLYPQQLTNLPMLYDVIRCSHTDTETIRDLWDCEDVRPAVRGHCDPVTNAAGVTCEPSPPPQQHTTSQTAAVLADVSCNATTLISCFKSSTSVVLTLQHFTMEPDCSSASKQYVNDSAVCYQIPLQSCRRLTAAVNDSSSYCYDVVYSPYSSDEHLLLVAGMTDVTSRVCCVVVEKTGRAVADLSVTQHRPQPHLHTSSHNLTFTITCFQHESFTGDTVNGQTVRRGEHVYCLTRLHTWDERLLLVVDNCYFSPHRRPHNASYQYQFIDNRCPTTDLLDLLFYSSHPLRWGVRFAVPKFQAFETLYVSCSAYICDTATVDRPSLCDRSCDQTTTSTTTTTTTRTRTRTGRRGRRWTAAGRHHRLETHFTVTDDGYGPVISDDMTIRYTSWQAAQSSVTSSLAVKPLMLLVHSVASAVFHCTLSYCL